MSKLIKRGEVWYTHVFVDGRRKQVSTRCKDRKAAEAAARQLESGMRSTRMRRSCAGRR